MKRTAILGIAAGLAIAAILIVMTGPAAIWTALAGAGWGIVAVIALHLPEMVFSALGWRALVAGDAVPGLLAFVRMRWIREAINALLPVGQIGGEFVSARLLALRGVPASRAGASVVLDLTTQMASQVVFTLLGLALFAFGAPDDVLTPWLAAGAAVGAVLVLLFIGAQRLGLFRLVEGFLVRLGERFGWSSLGAVSGLHDAIVAIYEDPRRLWRSGGHHLASWVLGSLEIWATLHALGVDAGLREAIIIEGLAQAARGMGVIVPGALGIQEGAFVLIGGLLGISHENAIAMALIRRIREIALGVPGLIAWHMMEGARIAARKAGVRKTTASGASP